MKKLLSELSNGKYIFSLNQWEVYIHKYVDFELHHDDYCEYITLIIIPFIMIRRGA